MRLMLEALLEEMGRQGYSVRTRLDGITIVRPDGTEAIAIADSDPAKCRELREQARKYLGVCP